MRGRFASDRAVRWLVGLVLVSAAATSSAEAAQPTGTAAPRAATDGDQQLLERHAAEVTGLTGQVEAVIGPLAPVAASPFFGLAALCGLALATDIEAIQGSEIGVVRLLAHNRLIAEARHYASPTLLFLLIGLAVFSYLANSGKIQGLLGKAFLAVEDSSSLLVYTLLVARMLTRHRPPAEAAPIAAMSLVGLPAMGWLAVAAPIGLATLMAVRYALDILIWLSPFPFVDLVFETLKKLVTAGLVALYIFSPTLATVVTLVLFLVSLLLLGWALRLVRFLIGVVITPWLGGLLGASAPPLRDVSLETRLGLGGTRIRVSIPVTALLATGLHKRQRAWLVADDDAVTVWSKPLLRRPRPLRLSGSETRRVLVRTALWLELRILEQGPEPAACRHRLALSRAYGAAFAELLRALGAEDGGDVGALGWLRRAARAAG